MRICRKRCLAYLDEVSAGWAIFQIDIMAHFYTPFGAVCTHRTGPSQRKSQGCMKPQRNGAYRYRYAPLTILFYGHPPNGRAFFMLYLLLAVDAAVCAFGHFCGLLELLLGLADALGIAADLVIHPAVGVDGFPDRIGLGLFQQLQNQRHAHIFAVEGLAEIGGAGIVVHLHADLIDPGQGM